MDSGETLSGRPYGGCSILWNSKLSCKVSPVDSKCLRLCAVTVELPSLTFLLVNMYMPTDTRYDRGNLGIYDDVLAESSSLAKRLNVDHIIYTGDLNTEFCRVNSLHATSLSQFLTEECVFEPNNSIDFTYESKVSGDRSFLDHFLLSENFRSKIRKYDVLHEGDNLSDHSPVMLTLSLSVDCFTPRDVTHKSLKLNWNRASDQAIDHYQHLLSKQLSTVPVPVEACMCCDHSCTEHSSDITQYCDDIIRCLTNASIKTIPKCKPVGKACLDGMTRSNRTETTGFSGTASGNSVAHQRQGL